MTIETKTSEKGRISYFGNGSQTRLGTIVDGLIGGETYEIINLNGDRKIFAGYTSKTKKEIAAFIKAPKAEIDAAEYAVNAEAQDVATYAEIRLATAALEAEAASATTAEAKAAIENNLPVYRASCLTYTYKFIDAYFTNAIDAHKWLIAQAKKNPNFADGGLVITREISSNLDAELYCFSDKLYEINAADEPEFATYIYEVEGAQYLDYRYNKMKDFAEHLSNCGLSKEQIHQVLIVKCQNEKSSEVGKLVKKFRRANDEIDQVTCTTERSAFTGGAQFTFDVQRFATTDIVTAAIENLPDDMKDEVRADYAPYKAEFNAAIEGIYLDDFSEGCLGNPPIIPAADLFQKIIPLALTDHSSTVYRKNSDGTFTEDKAAFKRLEQLEKRIFTAAGHKIGIDNPDRFAANFNLAVHDSEVDGWSHLEIGGEQLTFNRGKLVAISSPRYDAEMRFNGKTRIYYYRSYRLKTKKEFFARIENEDRAAEQSELVAEFMTAHEMTDTLHNPKEQIGKFLVQIEPTLPNGRMFYYAKAVDDLNAGKAIIDEFKKCAVLFTARIRENCISGKKFYGRALNGDESNQIPA